MVAANLVRIQQALRDGEIVLRALRVVDLDAGFAAGGENLRGGGCESEDVDAVGSVDRVLGEVLLRLRRGG